MSEFMAMILTHDFALGVGVGVAICWMLSLTTVVWMCAHAERSEG